MEEDRPKIQCLQDLMDYRAAKFISAEIQLKNKLPRWVNAVSTMTLKYALLNYLKLIQQHIQKLEGFFEAERITSMALSNKVMLALVSEVDDDIINCANPYIRDACLLADVQQIVHFKISAYATETAFARVLGVEEFASIFYEAEVNEKHILGYLSQLSIIDLNSMEKKPYYHH